MSDRRRRDPYVALRPPSNCSASFVILTFSLIGDRDLGQRLFSQSSIDKNRQE
uniref:Uncharacterized protein n=1 Tax=Heterorhabditis bacteriophora TaxID=37862 RepID=A0A1I7WDC7_HETBA